MYVPIFVDTSLRADLSFASFLPATPQVKPFSLARAMISSTATFPVKPVAPKMMMSSLSAILTILFYTKIPICRLAPCCSSLVNVLQVAEIQQYLYPAQIRDKKLDL